MNARVRRNVDMGTSVRTFARSHPVNSPEFVLILGEMDGLLLRIDALDGQQRTGLLDRHAAAKRVREIEARIRSLHVPHMQQAGQKAARIQHELGTVFRIKPAKDSRRAFRTAAGTMAAAAKEHQDVLVKEGMSPAVLNDLDESLAELDAATELGKTARAAHVGASAELEILADQVVKQARMLDAVNQLAFQEQPELLAAWQAVRRLRPKPKPGEAVEGPDGGTAGSTPTAAVNPAPAGDVRPAA